MSNEGGGTVHGPLTFGRKMKQSRVADVNQENKWPLETTSGCPQVAFHNPSFPGGAMDRSMTKTDCLHLPAPTMGNKY